VPQDKVHNGLLHGKNIVRPDLGNVLIEGSLPFVEKRGHKICDSVNKIGLDLTFIKSYNKRAIK